MENGTEKKVVFERVFMTPNFYMVLFTLILAFIWNKKIESIGWKDNALNILKKINNRNVMPVIYVIFKFQYTLKVKQSC